MFVKLSLVQKFQMSFLLSFIFFLLIVGFSYFGFSSLKENHENIATDTVPDIVAILELKSLSKRLFAEIQGYVATMEEGEQGEFKETLETFDEWMAKWQIQSDDLEENLLKEEMATHREVFAKSGEQIFTLGTTYLNILEDFTERAELFEQSLIAEETEAHGVHHDEIEDLESLHVLHRFQILVYRSLARYNEDDDEDEESDETEKEEPSAHGNEHDDTDENDLAAIMVVLTEHFTNEHPDDKTLADIVSSIENFSLLGQELINVRSRILESVEEVEIYEDEVLATVEKLVQLQDNEVSQSFRATESGIGRVALAFLLLSIFYLVISVVFYRALSRSVTTPVDNLAKAIHKVSQGDYTTRVDSHLSDEFGYITHKFNEMVEVLERTTVSREFMDTVLKSLTESLFVVTGEGRMRMVNDAACSLVGLSRGELLGQKISTVIGDWEQQQIIDQAMAAGQWSGDLILHTHDGKDVDVLLSVSLLDKENVDRGLVILATDISKIKQIQTELIKTNEELMQTQDQLVQSSKLASIGELAAGVAHELNQPLMIMRTGTQLMERKRKKGGLTEVAIEHHLESMNSNSKRMMKIIDHLRTFARQSSVDFTPVDVHKAIQNCYYLIGEQFRLSNIKIVEDFATDATMISGDVYQLEQVFLNLFGNARDAIEEKRGLSEENAGLEGNITVSTKVSEEDSKMFEIFIRDNGAGLAQGSAAKLFDPFYTTKEEGKGTGLGLSITYGIIQDHKGTIEVFESSGEGTTMRIRLPIAG